jgi:hypothetical protein
MLLSSVVWAGGSRSPDQEVPKEPQSNGSKVVRETIVIRRAGTYDFKGVLHVWKGKNWNCNADRENGPQILRIEADNVVIKNFHYKGDGKSGSNGLGDPIHIATCGQGQGNRCPKDGPRNVVLDGIKGHACEDLITIGTPGVRDITIRNSYLVGNRDKSVQVNFGQNINFENNTFVGGGACIRYKPRTSGRVRNNTFYKCGAAIRASSNDPDISPMQAGPTTVEVKGNKFINVGTEIQRKGSQVKIINK